MRLREFKEPKQKLDEIAIFGVPLWVALSFLMSGGIIQWNSLTPKQKQNTFNWFNNNIKKNKELVQKALPYVAPGGLSKGLNTPVKIETLKDLGLKTSPVTGNPATQDPNFNVGKKNKTISPNYSTPLVQPGDSSVNKNNQNKGVKIKKDGTVISTTKKDEPSVWDNITNWFKDTFTSDTKKDAPISKVDKRVLAPSIDSKTKKVNPAYKVPVISKPVDNGDGTVTWNGQVYDKVFDKTKIAQINKSIIDNQKRRQQGSYVPPTNIDTKIGGKNKSVGVDKGGAGTVSGGAKDRGSAGGAFGNPGLGGEIGKSGVSGGKNIDVDGTVKGQIGDITQGSTISKGKTGAEAIPKGTAVPVSGVKVEPLAKVIPKNVAIARTGPFPPGTMPPPIAQLPLAKQTRKYDPTKDKDIIYKGKVAPDAVSKFKATKSNPQKNKDYYDKLIKKFS